MLQGDVGNLSTIRGQLDDVVVYLHSLEVGGVLVVLVHGGGLQAVQGVIHSICNIFSTVNLVSNMQFLD